MWWADLRPTLWAMWMEMPCVCVDDKLQTAVGPSLALSLASPMNVTRMEVVLVEMGVGAGRVTPTRGSLLACSARPSTDT